MTWVGEIGFVGFVSFLFDEANCFVLHLPG